MRNELVIKTNSFNPSLQSCVGITFTFVSGKMAGKTCVEGKPETITIQGADYDVVRFKGLHQGKPILAVYTDNAPLAELVAQYHEFQAGQKALTDAEQSIRAEEIAAKMAPLIAAMEAEAARIAAQIPSGDVRVAVTQTGTLDGAPTLSYEAEGVALSEQDIVMLGSAEANLPGVWAGGYRIVRVAYITRARLDAIKGVKAEAAAETLAKTEAAQADTAEKFAEAARTGQPVLLRSYTEPRERAQSSLDKVAIYAHPDGTTSETRTPCH